MSADPPALQVGSLTEDPRHVMRECERIGATRDGTDGPEYHVRLIEIEDAPSWYSKKLLEMCMTTKR